MSPPEHLFETITAWFSPLIAPADRAQWCHLGGSIPSAHAVESHEAAIDVCFGIWDYYGEHDELVQRVLDLGLDVVDYRWIAECVAARGLVDVWPYCFATLAERDSEGYIATEPEPSDDSLDADEVQDLLVSPFDPLTQRSSNSHAPYRPSRLSQVTRFSSSSSSHHSSSPAAPRRSQSPEKPAPTFSREPSRPHHSTEHLATPSRSLSHRSPSPSPPKTQKLPLFPSSSASGSQPVDLQNLNAAHVSERVTAPERRDQQVVDELARLKEAASQESSERSSSQVRRSSEIEEPATRCREDPDRWQDRCDFGTPDEEVEEEDDSGFYGEVLCAEMELVVEAQSGDGRKRAGEDLREGERDSTRRRTSSEAEQPAPAPEPEIKVEEVASPPLQFFTPEPTPAEPLAPFFAALVLPGTDLPTFSIPALLASMPQLEGLDGSARSKKLREGLPLVSNGQDGFLATRIVKGAVMT